MEAAGGRRRLARAALVAGVLSLATVAAALPLCDLLFGCGCTWPWAGGVRHCNVFLRSSPHCPWCAYPRSADASLGAILAAEAWGAWAMPGRSWSGAILGGVLAGGAAAFAVRGLVAWWAGYPA